VKRREFLKLFGVGMGIVALFEAFPRIIRQKMLVRPPGSLVDETLNALCIRCGRCVQVCPTGAIVLASLGDGFRELGTPKIDPLRGPCERYQGRCQQQAKCAQICPSAAIRQVQRRDIKMGSAIINADRCIAWRGGLCLVCYEVCPVQDAISLVDESRPIFNAKTCVGCGRCVYACPAQPKALVLTPKGEKRVWPT